jgi:NodT family efflux transporter outer membrane factor (OMF) lipoprotein
MVGAETSPMSAHNLTLWQYLRALAVFGAAGLSGCATVGSSGVGGVVAVPGRWQAGNAKTGALDAAALATWWERFRDPALNELVRAALVASPDVRTAVSKIAESRARRGVERASLFPWLTAGASASTSRQENRGGSNTVQLGTGSTGSTSTGVTTDLLQQSTGLSQSTTRTQSYSGSLDASWEVDLFGKQWQNVKARSADLAQAQENFYAAQVSLVAEVAEEYVVLRQAEERLAVVEGSVATRSETLQITQWREQAGQGNALETQQSLSTLEEARAAIPSYKETIGQSCNRLALLVGRTPGGVNAIVAKTHSIPAAPARLAIGIPAETLAQRPDVRAAEQAVYAAVARTKSAQRERLPSLNISGTLSTEALSSGRIFSPQAIAASLLAGLTAPIFKGGQITSTIMVQTELERQALLTYESKVLTALSEVENALISVQRTAERLAILVRASAAARLAQQLAVQRYTAGEVDILTVLEAQRTLLSVEDEQVSTRASQVSAHLKLYKALGGGWLPR